MKKLGFLFVCLFLLTLVGCRKKASLEEMFTKLENADSFSMDIKSKVDNESVEAIYKFDGDKEYTKSLGFETYVAKENGKYFEYYKLVSGKWTKREDEDYERDFILDELKVSYFTKKGSKYHLKKEHFDDFFDDAGVSSFVIEVKENGLIITISGTSNNQSASTTITIKDINKTTITLPIVD